MLKINIYSGIELHPPRILCQLMSFRVKLALCWKYARYLHQMNTTVFIILSSIEQGIVYIFRGIIAAWLQCYQYEQAGE